MSTTCLPATTLTTPGMPLYVCTLLADLRAIDLTNVGSLPTTAVHALVAGGFAIADGGGGHFVYNANVTNPDDGRNNIAPTGFTGTWQRVV